MGKNTRILVIDDNETVRDTVAMALELEGYRVDKVENGKEAIEKSHSNFYNPAIVDWRLTDNPRVKCYYPDRPMCFRCRAKLFLRIIKLRLREMLQPKPHG